MMDIESLFQANELDEVLDLIGKLLLEDPRREDLYFWQGKVHYKRQEWGKAINSFNKVLEINPNNRDAKSQIDMANNILGYFTPDMFNP